MRKNFRLMLGSVFVAIASTGCDGDIQVTNGGNGGGPSSEGSSHPGDGGGGSSQAGFEVGGGAAGPGCELSCEQADADCGPVADGCGDIMECGDCTPPEFCGGGGPSKCGFSACTPATCASLGADCGPAGDGCGSAIDCGSCSLPEQCGGVTPSACGIPSDCDNLCLQQVTCPDPAVTTTISGVVYAPNGVDPLPSAIVYVPNAPVDAFAPGVVCDQCGAQVSGDPLVSAVTDASGAFVLENAPVGANIPLVIQIGRWRRQITVSTVSDCVDNPLVSGVARLPRTQAEGDIPRMAFATGRVDSLECVLRKIGVDDAEFGNPGGNARIHFYRGTGSSGARIDGATPNENTLWNSLATLSGYDMVLFPCQGDEYDSRLTPQGLQNVIDYAAAGGRVFTTHYSYVWLQDNGSFDGSAVWDTEDASPSPDPQIGYIDMSFPKGALLAQWLLNIGASSVLGEMEIDTLRNDFDAVIAPSQLWVQVSQPSTVPMHMTFNTPVGAPIEEQCGRVLFSDFHVEDAINANVVFPAECPAGPMTPQEKMLMFMIFDLGACITPDIPMCTPVSCQQQMIECGPAGDGCGGLIDCGPCPPGETCGGGGQPGICGTQGCTPIDCQDQGIECGPAGDGCGGLIPSCGTCAPPESCGGAGIAGECGVVG